MIFKHYTVVGILAACTVGWVNLLKNIQFVVNSFYQKNGETFKKKFCGSTGMWICMDLQIFASFLYPTLLKICTQKFDRKYFQFCYYMYCKKINF